MNRPSSTPRRGHTPGDGRAAVYTELRAGPQVLVRVCLFCGRAMEPYQRTVYLDSGAVVHVPCRRAFRGAATTSMAVIRPTSQAMRVRARERPGAGASVRTASAKVPG